jgi:hypothetical protein
MKMITRLHQDFTVNDYLGLAVVEQFLSTSKRTIIKWIEDGMLPAKHVPIAGGKRSNVGVYYVAVRDAIHFGLSNDIQVDFEMLDAPMDATEIIEIEQRLCYYWDGTRIPEPPSPFPTWFRSMGRLIDLLQMVEYDPYSIYLLKWTPHTQFLVNEIRYQMRPFNVDIYGILSPGGNWPLHPELIFDRAFESLKAATDYITLLKDNAQTEVTVS